MNYTIFLGGSVCNIDEDIYINLEKGNNNFQNFNFNPQLFEYIKYNISKNLEDNISFIKFSPNDYYIIIKYNNDDEFNKYYNLLLEQYNQYYKNIKEDFINSLSKEDYKIRDFFSNLGEDKLNEFELYSTNFFNKNIIINQLDTELGNIITVKENNKHTENLTVLLMKDNNIFNIVHLYNNFDWVRGLDIGFFEKGFNSYISISKNGNIKINKNISVEGKILYIKKKVYKDLYDGVLKDNNENIVNYTCSLLTFSLESINEHNLTILPELYDNFIYIKEDNNIEYYNALVPPIGGSHHGYELEILFENGEIKEIIEEGFQWANGKYRDIRYRDLLNDKYI